MSELTYGSFNEVRYARREHNDCVVCALAVATQTPYPEVHALMKSLGRRDRGRTAMPLINAGLCTVPAEEKH